MKKQSKPGSTLDPQKIAGAGFSFLNAAERCLEVRTDDGGQIQVEPVPGIVCGAFGAELCLKAIICAEGGNAGELHSLLQLFNKLSPESRQQIAQDLSLSEHDLRQKVGSIAKTFIDWRYFYEKPILNSYLPFLLAFARVVDRRARGLLTNAVASPVHASGP